MHPAPKAECTIATYRAGDEMHDCHASRARGAMVVSPALQRGEDGPRPPRQPRRDDGNLRAETATRVECVYMVR
jgi:hypothetical protein